MNPRRMMMASAGAAGGGWNLANASYDSKSHDVTSEESSPRGVEFSTDGTKMYVVGWTNDTVYQYTLSTEWDVSTASYASKSFSVNSQAIEPNGVRFNDDGTTMFILNGFTHTVYQYTLSTGWDVSTASYASKSHDFSSEGTAGDGFAFNLDGTIMYIMIQSTEDIYQYTLSSAWDVSTASYASKSADVSSEDSNMHGIHFSSDGTRLFTVGASNDDVFQYNLSSAWDVSTASYASINFNIQTEMFTPWGVTFHTDGEKMYVIDNNLDVVHQYSTS